MRTTQTNRAAVNTQITTFWAFSTVSIKGQDPFVDTNHPKLKKEGLENMHEGTWSTKTART